MIVTDNEIEKMARDLIARHGPGAVRVAMNRLNDMIDRHNVRARDVWACVVHQIHVKQGTGPSWPERRHDSGDAVARLKIAL